jgi:hypothetical protein
MTAALDTDCRKWEKHNNRRTGSNWRPSEFTTNSLQASKFVTIHQPAKNKVGIIVLKLVYSAVYRDSIGV